MQVCSLYAACMVRATMSGTMKADPLRRGLGLQNTRPLLIGTAMLQCSPDFNEFMIKISTQCTMYHHIQYVMYTIVATTAN